MRIASWTVSPSIITGIMVMSWPSADVARSRSASRTSEVEISGRPPDPVEEKSRLGPVMRAVIDEVGDELAERLLACGVDAERVLHWALEVGHRQLSHTNWRSPAWEAA